MGLKYVRNKKKKLQVGKRGKPKIYKSFFVDPDTAEALNHEQVHAVINSLTKNSIPEKKALETVLFLKCSEVVQNYLKSPYSNVEQLQDFLGCTIMRSKDILTNVDFRELSVWEFFGLQELTRLNHARKPGVRDIAREVGLVK